jgi:acyl transferase domain-containing protein/NADPH:quinone reductase-like Zn-dependent oxidoreductase
VYRFLSPDGRCFAFDSRANGYGRGEGVATIVIKRLRDAVAAGDPIRAVIRETLLNQDGKTETITSPSQDAQRNLMRECYARAHIDPQGTQYFEAHGTGTPTGDPIEVGAIAAVFQGKKFKSGEPLRIGSVKTNIGHAEATSGLASIIKVTLAMEHGMLPPSVNFEKPNPKLSLEEWGIKVAREFEQWPSLPGCVRRASVNNFGYGGSNSHVIMEDGEYWLEALKNTKANGITNGSTKNADELPAASYETNLLILSGKDEQTTKTMVTNLKAFLEEEQSGLSGEDAKLFLQKLSYTLGQRRTMFPWLAAYPVPINQGIEAAVTALESRSFRASKIADRQPRIGMVFTGQGAQWYAMGRELITTYPMFGDSIKEADSILKELGADWSLMEELHRDAETTRVNGTGFSIPICVAVQIALVRLLDSWGIKPSAVTSHSSGEIGAAYAVGAISLRRAMGIAYFRSKLAADLTQRSTSKGGMIAVGLGRQDSEEYLKSLTCGGKAVVACVNSPSSTTVAGDLPAVLELETMLQKDGVFGRRLRVETAYHSHHMSPIAEDYRTSLNLMADDSAKPVNRIDSIVYGSPVTGYRMSNAETIAHADHWVGSLVQPVQFVDAFTEMVLGGLDSDDGSASSSIDVVIEVGPHTALGGPIKEILGLPDFEGIKLPYYGCLVRHTNAMESMQALAADLMREGHPVNMEAINFPNGRGSEVRVLTNLPPYPWNHSTKHWIEPRVNKALRERSRPPHHLLGQLIPGTNIDEPSWRHILRPIEAPWVRDHSIQSNMLYPGCGFVSLAIEAVREQLALTEETPREIAGYHIRDIDVLQALVIPDTADGLEIQTVLRPVSDKAIGVRGWKQFEVLSVTADNEWTRHVHGLILVEFGDPEGATGLGLDKNKKPLDPTAGYAKRIDPNDMWNVLTAHGLHYGPTFRNIKSIIQSGKEMRSISEVVIPDTSVAKELPYDHVVHPAFLDSAAQATFTALPGTESRQDSPRVFQSIDRLWISSKISNQFGHAFVADTILHRADAQGIETDITMVDKDAPEGAKPVLEIKKLVLSSLGRSASNGDDKPWEKQLCTKIEWAPDASLGFQTANLIHPLDNNETRAIKDIRRVCLYYIQDALAAIPADEATQLGPDETKFYRWMQEQVLKANEGKLGAGSESWLFDTKAEREIRLHLAAQSGVSGELVCLLGQNLLAALLGNKALFELMKKDGLLDKYEEQTRARAVSQAADLLRQIVHKNPKARILEIGATAGASTLAMLQALGTAETGGPLAESYQITNVSCDDELEAAARGEFAAWNDILSFDSLDIEQDPSAQDFELEFYDVVIATHSLSSTTSVASSLSNAKSLMKQGAKLLIVEDTQESIEKQFVFGLVGSHATSGVSYWSDLLQEAGFSGIDIELRDCASDEMYTTSTILSSVPPTTLPQPPSSSEIILVTSSKTGPSLESTWLASLQRAISQAGSFSGSLPAVHVVESAPPTSFAGKVCIFVGEIDKPLLRDLDDTTMAGIKAMATTSKGLLWVTRGAAVECRNPDLALAQGLLRSLRNEYLTKTFVTLDLDPTDATWSVKSVPAIVKVLNAGFSIANADASQPQPGEFEYALRDGTIMIPRLFKDQSRSKKVSPDDVAEQGTSATSQPFFQPDRPLSMHVGMPGLMDTIAFDDDPAMSALDAVADLAPHLIEVEPRAYGVNFRDVMVAMGQLNERIMGLECSGIIKRVGTEAAEQGYSVGDKVFCLLRGPFGSRLHVEWTSVAHMPEDLSFEDAASLPVIFCTAYIGLIDMARLRKGQTVLIHAAAGGVGQAAIMIAKHLGLEIYATVGTPDKRELVMSQYGIPDDHIFSSRDSSFSAGVLAATNGRGVDAVLNSLAGPLLQESFNVLAPFGYFIEIGKRDLEINSQLEMRPFTRQVSFSAFYLLASMNHSPLEVHRVLNKLTELLTDKIIAPVHPITAFPMGEFAKAFRLLQTGKHMGKVVLAIGPQEMVPVLPRTPTAKFSSEASYLIVGGLGGIGRSIAHWMMARGAKNLIFMSRSAGNGKNSAFLDEIRQAGSIVQAVSCNVSDQADVSRALRSCEEMGLPPIRGVIQAAMVLQVS